MKWFFDTYLRNNADGNNPLIALVLAILNGLQATTIFGAQNDTLKSKGKLLTKNLEK